MLNENLSIANALKNNIKNSMMNNIYSISLLQENKNSNLYRTSNKNNQFINFQYINPIICGQAKCGSYKNDNLFFEFCN